MSIVPAIHLSGQRGVSDHLSDDGLTALLLVLLLFAAQHLILETPSRIRSRFQSSYQTPPERAQKRATNYNLDPNDDREGIQTHPVEFIADRKRTFRSFQTGGMRIKCSTCIRGMFVRNSDWER